MPILRTLEAWLLDVATIFLLLRVAVSGV